MRHQLQGGPWAALLVAALATTAAVAQPAPSRTAPGRSAAIVSDVGPPPAEDRDSHGAIVLGTAPPKLAGEAARATQTMGASSAPTRKPEVESLRKRGAGSLNDN